MLTIKEGLLNGNSSYFYLYKKVFIMTINIGNIEVAKFYLGTEDDIKIYLEETLLYPQLPSFKFKAEYSGGVSYSAECDSSTTLATGDTKPSGYQYTAMTSSEVGQCITNIDVEAFRYCTSLSSVTLSDSVTTIGNSAFRGCSSLTAITINATTPPTLGNNAFSGTNDCPIYVPCESVNAYKSASGWSTYSSRIQCKFEGKWKATYSDSHIESAQCDSSSAITQNEINLTNLVSVEIGGCVTSIGERVFQNCSSLTTCNIGSSVTSIGNSAFGNCSGIASCTIGSGVTSISDFAFYRCSGLTSVTVNATTPPTLGSFAFRNTNDCPIYVPSGSVNAYKSAWSDYASQIEPIPNS